jgi:membrane protein YdbS with pleckstrin-like domain
VKYLTLCGRVGEHRNTSSSPRGSVISIPEFTFLVIAIVFELHIYLAITCAIYISCAFLTYLSCCCHLVGPNIFRFCTCKINVNSTFLHAKSVIVFKTSIQPPLDGISSFQKV